eukprot:CAMPEP_0115264248 /NCGR_PEP_ID=MMETSP0270-20121206/50331_1 /TAXON_ID=71861 /ORGANISM="Scrippsiella trochoidea, Strain CCMP3099" /LENGTH=50 /DNA_ID=CAMNT_0002680261 /DNA_START=152 /DNA_END=304 /DNA_ORIENTATION=-
MSAGLSTTSNSTLFVKPRERSVGNDVEALRRRTSKPRKWLRTCTSSEIGL